MAMAHAKRAGCTQTVAPGLPSAVRSVWRPGIRVLSAATRASVLLGISSIQLAGQAARVSSRASCTGCAIQVQQIATLKGIGFDGPAPLIQSLSTESYVLVDPADGVVKSIAADGKVLVEFGRHGGGPGEYEVVRNVIVAEDARVHIVDAVLARHSVFLSDGKFVGSSSVGTSGGAAMGGAILGNGSLVLNTRPTPTRLGAFSIVVYDAAGKPLASLDSVDARLGEPWRWQRLFWSGRDGRLVVARPYSSVIEIYDRTLSTKQTLLAAAPWVVGVEPNGQPEYGIFDKPFTPRVAGVWADKDGLLWVCALVPSESWKPVAPLPPGKVTEADFRRLSARPRVRTIIAAIDPRSSRFVATSSIDGMLGLPFGQGLFVRRTEDARGEEGSVISKATLVRR